MLDQNQSLTHIKCDSRLFCVLFSLYSTFLFKSAFTIQVHFENNYESFFLLNYKWFMKWSDISWGQVWCPILGICALYLTPPSAVVNSSEHTHTHTRSSLGNHIAVAPREQLGVWCLAQGSHLSRGIEGAKEHWLFTPPTDKYCRTWDSNPQPSG